MYIGRENKILTFSLFNKFEVNMKTLQELLEIKVQSEGLNGPVEITPDFRVAVQGVTESGGIHIIIHPSGHNGDTLDFTVKGNTLIPAFANRPPNPPDVPDLQRG